MINLIDEKLLLELLDAKTINPINRRKTRELEKAGERTGDDFRGP